MTGLVLGLTFGLVILPFGKALAAAGDLDPTFGAGGLVITDILAAFNVANDMAIQFDGKIVVVGQTFRLRGFGPALWTMCRYNSDGSLDNSFDHDGKVTTLFPRGSSGNPLGVAIQPDGKIVVAGLSDFAIDRMVITRYESDGSMDKTFGGDGIAVLAFEGLLADVKDVEIQNDGKIILAGSGGPSLGDAGYHRFLAGRLNSDGSPDGSFGNAGKVVTDFGAPSLAHDLAIQPDGKIVITGEVLIPFVGPGFPTDFVDIALARYEINGTPDVTFNGNGRVISDIFDRDNYGDAVIVQSDGKIIVAGLISAGFGVNAELLARYDSNGLLDPSFDSDGVIMTSGGWANDVAIQPDGRIVVVRFSHDGFSLSRHNPNGSLDVSFGGGVVTTQFSTTRMGSERSCCTVIQGDGRIIVAGFNDVASQTKGDFALARYLGN
jgi:uncharacterized delta-60 repeat protein